MFQDNLKTLRKNKGFTQEELAARLNVVRQTVSKWEKGQSVPDSEMLVRLAEIFEVPVSQLLGGPIAMGPPKSWLTGTSKISANLTNISESGTD